MDDVFGNEKLYSFENVFEDFFCIVRGESFSYFQNRLQGLSFAVLFDEIEVVMLFKGVKEL